MRGINPPGSRVANLSGARGLRTGSAAAWRGASEIRPSGGAAISPEAAGTERAHHGGVSLTRLHADSEGSHRGASQLGRARRSFSALRAGVSKR